MTRGRLPIARRLRRSRGITIVTAIFLLVVLAGLGVAIVTISTAQHRSSALDLLGTRAYEAARTGADYGMYQRLLGNCANANFQAAGGLSAMTVSVTCVTTNVAMSDGSVQTQVRITSTACNQPAGGACPNNTPGPDYVQRVVQVVF